MTGPVGAPGAEAFLEEAGELLELLEHGLLALEQRSDPERIDEVFRALHTIKGSGAMFGFAALADFVHHFEDAFDRVRAGTLTVDRRLIDLSLAARDQMLALLQAGPAERGAAPLSADAEVLITAITAILCERDGNVAPAADTPRDRKDRAAVECDGQDRHFHIRFRPAPEALLMGMRPDLLVEELCSLGTATVTVDAGHAPPLEQIDPTASYLEWSIDLRTAEPLKTIEGIFIFADDAELTIEEIGPSPTQGDDHVSSPQVQAGCEPDAAAPAQATGGARPSAGPSSRTGAASSLSGSSTSEHVRVPARRLDELMDQLGELVIAQSRLQAMAAHFGDGALTNLVEEIDRLTTGLRDTTLSLRMLPIEVVFGKFRRVVRDLSANLGKDVTLVTSGGETEIDKTVIDRLSEPLVHMIRNAIDHGIEDGETRAALGKAGGGTITLTAWQEGGDVLIAIEDDGGGLDTAAIRHRAETRGLIEPGAVMSDAELGALIFAPGFSTAETLSSVSGRGVGMDAVRTAVDALRGKIRIDSEPGRGTRITLSLPVSLAIIESFLVALDGQAYVLPLAVVEECVEYDSAVGAAAVARPDSGRRMIELRERLVPYIDLRSLFGCPPSADAGRRIVVVRSEGALIGLVVDDILGQAQTVIKALAPQHRAVGGFSGATILGDGRVALILDVVALSQRARAARGAVPMLAGPRETAETPAALEGA